MTDTDKYNGDDWVRVLISFPQFAKYCNWKKLSEKNWIELLKVRPEFSDKWKHYKLWTKTIEKLNESTFRPMEDLDDILHIMCMPIYFSLIMFSVPRKIIRWIPYHSWLRLLNWEYACRWKNCNLQYNPLGLIWCPWYCLARIELEYVLTLFQLIWTYGFRSKIVRWRVFFDNFEIVAALPFCKFLFQLWMFGCFCLRPFMKQTGQNGQNHTASPDTTARR